MEHAAAKLRQTMLSNLYLLPRILGLEQDHIDMGYSSNLADKCYRDEVPEEVFVLWEPSGSALGSHRLSECTHAARAAALYRNVLPIEDGATRAKRSRLVTEASRLKYPRPQ